MGVVLERGDEPVGGEGSDPAPIQARLRSSRTPCHTSQAPPISATAATTNRVTERRTDMAGHGTGQGFCAVSLDWA